MIGIGARAPAGAPQTSVVARTASGASCTTTLPPVGASWRRTSAIAAAIAPASPASPSHAVAGDEPQSQRRVENGARGAQRPGQPPQEVVARRLGRQQRHLEPDLGRRVAGLRVGLPEARRTGARGASGSPSAGVRSPSPGPGRRPRRAGARTGRRRRARSPRTARPAASAPAPVGVGVGAQRRDRVGLELRRARVAQQAPHLFAGDAREDDRRRGLGPRMQAEGRGRDQPQRPQRSGQQLRQVEPGDVLDHLAAAAHARAVGAHERDPDDQVAHRAIARPARAEGVAGDDAAHGGALGPRRIQRQHLPVRRQRALHIRQPRAALDGDDLIQRRVLDDAVERRGAQDDVQRFGRRAQAKLGAATDEDQALVVASAGGDHLGRLVERRRLDDRRRQHAAHAVGGAARARAGDHARSAWPERSVAWGR